MRRNKKRFGRSSGRRGYAIVLVLACCSVAVALVMVSLQTSLKQRRQLRSEFQLEQTRWVLDAAVRKSIADPPSEANEYEVKPKLEKFGQVLVGVVPAGVGEQVKVRAKVFSASGTSVAKRSASFEVPD